MVKIRKIVMGAIAYYIINIKSLLIDKLSFVWSITLPLIMYFINSGNIDNMQDLSYYWCYMIISSYVFGLGIYAVEMRESGCLRTIFSINKSKVAYIIGNIATQLSYMLICVSVFNIVISINSNYGFLEMEKYCSLLIILCFPIGIGSYFVSVLHIFYISSIKTLMTILLFFLLILSNCEYQVNKFNLLYIIPKILYGNINYGMRYVVICILLLLAGAIGIYDFGAISKEKR